MYLFKLIFLTVFVKGGRGAVNITLGDGNDFRGRGRGGRGGRRSRGKKEFSSSRLENQMNKYWKDFEGKQEEGEEGKTIPISTNLTPFTKISNLY